MKKRLHFKHAPSQVILFSFFVTIAVGGILLALPVSSADGNAVPFVDALFTATTATCVTGLVTLPVVTTWSLFGQIVILLLIQVGGLGIITILSGFMIALHRRMGLGDRLLIQDAFNLNTLSGLIRFVKKVILGTLAVEGIGALLCMAVFVPRFGAKGIWISIFHAVSAFCNAGIDILSENSLCEYAANPLINLVTCTLIVLGGIGYIVWLDVARVLRQAGRNKRRWLHHLSLHSKIALSSTAFLIVTGALAVLIFEYNNPLTLKDYSLFDKIQISIFQSVTTRTAGFATLPQQYLTNSSSIICILLMFIGGSPVGTAGGVKTVTVTLLIASAIATVKNKNEAVLWGRSISGQAIRKAIAVVGMSFFILFVSTLLLSAVTDAPALDIFYETVSATATVGLTRSLTPTLTLWGKIIVMATMYLGRVGPISLAIAFTVRKKSQNIVKNPTEEICVG